MLEALFRVVYTPGTPFFHSLYTKHSLFASLQKTGTVLMLSSVNDATALPPFSALHWYKYQKLCIRGLKKRYT